jgi:putative two-component system response regulator
MKRRILFVDDEPHVLEGLRRMLHAHRLQWDMTFVGSTEEALNQICGGIPDVIVSDVAMPGKDGFELLTELRSSEDTKDVPVVMLTGARDDGLKRKALTLGATDLLNKPVNREDLVARLQSVLRLKSYQDELKGQNELLEQRVDERTAELAASRLDIIWRLGKAAECRDEDTGNHIVRVGCYCRILAEALGMKRGFVETLFLASPLHDIGKIGIPDSILLKEGPLTDDEWEVMRQHCAIGAELLRANPRPVSPVLAWRGELANLPREQTDNPILKMAASIALTHHERWDGAGYPGGLAGEAIPPESRIVAVSDVYDALRMERPYKPAYPESETLGIMEDEVGRHFDPTVFAAFSRSIEEFDAVRVELADEACCAIGRE